MSLKHYDLKVVHFLISRTVIEITVNKYLVHCSFYVVLSKARPQFNVHACLAHESTQQRLHG